jgi:hypothetical protein
VRRKRYGVLFGQDFAQAAVFGEVIDIRHGAKVST